MKLGLIADTHDNVPAVVKAVDVFNREAVDRVLHAGDYVSPFSLKPFTSLKCNFSGVWGNNDGDRLAVQNMAGGKISGSPSVMDLKGKRVLIGHYFETLDALVASGVYSLIVYGHTHRSEVRREGRTLVVNPGECGGWLYGKSTIAVCDLETLDAEIIVL